MSHLSIQDGNRSGDFVKTLTNPKTGEQGFAEGFHVHKSWAKKCLTFAQVMEVLEKEHKKTSDIDVKVSDIQPVVHNGKFMFYILGNIYDGTEWAFDQFSTKVGVPSSRMISHVMNGEPDESDSEMLRIIAANYLRKLDQNKEFKVRTYVGENHSTVRAFLSTKYAVVDNRWFVELMNTIAPNGLFSHWRMDNDTIYGNVLLPDTLIDYGQTDGSDYGGMISVGNSEIGTKSVSSLPSVFRSICMNGCIWNQKKGEKFMRKRHMGEIDLDDLAVQIRENVTSQIALVPEHVNKLLRLEQFRVDGSMKAHIATVCNRFSLSPKIAQMVLEEFVTNEKDHRNLFGIVNSVTRASQRATNDEWVDMDKQAGKALEWNERTWEGISSYANSMPVSEVEEIFGLVGV